MALAVLVAALLVACSPAPEGCPVSGLSVQVVRSANGIPVFFWLGQSNAGERANVSGTVGDDAVYKETVLGWERSKRYYTSEADAVPDDLAFTALAPISNLAGFEMAFAYNVGGSGRIIKHVRDGSDSKWWADHDEFTAATAYFTDQLALIGSTYYPAGIVICQGESDDAGTVSGWKSRWQAGIEIIRTAVGRRQMPVLLIRTHSSTSTAGLRAQQDGLVSEDAHAVTVDTDSYAPEASPHWTGPTIFRIGEDLATAYQTVDL